MMTMRIAVCDDCKADALLLKHFLRGHAVSMYSEAGSLLADIERHKMEYDLYFLDIYMEESINGLELAKRLREIQEEAIICFISSSDSFYREAYDLYAVQYLLKPIQEEQVERLLDKVSKRLARNNDQKLSFQFGSQMGTISYGKILYISSREHTLSIFCTDGTVQKCKGKLNDLAIWVCGDTFMRCHQSFIVNMYHVERMTGADLLVAGEWIPVSRRYMPGVKKRYQEILFEEVE